MGDVTSRASLITLSQDGGSVGQSRPSPSPRAQDSQRQTYRWSRPLPSERGYVDPWRQSADDGSVASRGSRLSALAPEAELGALIDKVDMISRTFNIFKVDTKAKDRDLGDTIYTMRGKMERQQIALEDLRHSNRDLEIRINNLSFSQPSHPNPSIPPASLTTSDKEAIANEVVGLLNLGSYATKAELEPLATKSDLASYLKSTEVSQFARVSLLADYVSSTQLNNMNFVNKAGLEHAMLNLGIPDRLLERVVEMERELNEPDGAIRCLDDTLKEFASRKRGGAGVSIGGISFKDQFAAEAWTQMLEGEDVYRFGFDMKMQILGLASSAHSTSDVVKDMADANRAGFSSTGAAKVKASFVVSLPESVFKESNVDTDAAKGGVKFTPPFSSSDTFEGDAEFSAKSTMETTLSNNRDRHQAALDLRFPPDQPKHAKAHAVFSAILRLGYFQAVGFLESLLPFNKMMVQAGMSHTEAWKKCLTYSRAVFTRIHEVRTVSTEHTAGSMLYGMMRATRMLESYGELGWIRHPDVSSALVVPALQKDGKSLTDSIQAQVKKLKDPQVTSNKNNIAELKAELKRLKEKNPSLST